MSRHRSREEMQHDGYTRTSESGRHYSMDFANDQRKKRIQQSSRLDRFSSGYGSLSDAGGSVQSQGSTFEILYEEGSRSPPPKYDDVFTYHHDSSQYDADENSYENIPANGILDVHSPSHTVIESTEKIYRTRFSRRDSVIDAPDMILMSQRSRAPFTNIINGSCVEYAKLSLSSCEQARYHLLQYAKKKWNLPTKVAEKFEFIDCSPTAIFRYHLVSMLENRWIESQSRPYRGEKLNTYVQSSANAFDYEIPTPTKFYNHEESFKIDGTERIEICNSCNGRGKVKCTKCDGSGSTLCERCHGYGTEPMTTHDCQQCSGGQEICPECHANGTIRCEKCDGRGKTVTFETLKVTWKLRSNIHMDRMDKIPREKLDKAHGNRVFGESAERLKPLTQNELLHDKVQRASKRFLSSHAREGVPRKQVGYSDELRTYERENFIHFDAPTRVGALWIGDGATLEVFSANTALTTGIAHGAIIETSDLDVSQKGKASAKDSKNSGIESKHPEFSTLKRME